MHPKLLELTVQSCREYIAAGDCHGEAPPTERLIDAVVQLSAALTGAKPAPAAPSGYKLVPLEPTREMAEAMFLAWKRHENIVDFAEIYAAMLAAAPAAQPADHLTAMLDKRGGVVLVDPTGDIRLYVADGKMSVAWSGKECADCTEKNLSFAQELAAAWNRARTLSAKETP